jgi:hypothetical protein
MNPVYASFSEQLAAMIAAAKTQGIPANYITAQLELQIIGLQNAPISPAPAPGVHK